MGEGAGHRIGSESTERAERSQLHGLTEILEQGEIGLGLLTSGDPVDHLDAAPRAEPTRRALAAALDRTELEREAGLLQEVDGVVEPPPPAMADQPAAPGERLVLEGG